MNNRSKIAVVALTAASLVGVAATAYASDTVTENLNGQHPALVTTPSSQTKVGPQAALGARRYAVVESTGVLVRGKNAFSADQVSGGSYEVFFDRDVSRCSYLATIGTTSTGTETPGSITVASRVGQPTGVWVDTSNLDGSDGTRAFHLEVIC